MHFADFNAVAAELHEGDQVRVRFVTGEELRGALAAPPTLGSPAREGTVSINVDGAIRHLTAEDMSLFDLVQ